MIIDDRMVTFIDSFEKGCPEYLEKLEQEAKEDLVPIIRKNTQSLLRFLMRYHKPLNILEVGTAVGFSALWMAEYAPAGAHITTIEKYEKRIPVAKENFKKAGRESQITLLEGDAAEILHSLDGQFDFVFMDAAKGQYLNFLPDLLRLTSEGGLIVSDNVLQDGDIIESRYAVTRRNRTIHSRMRDYLYELMNNEQLETVILPSGDGMTISMKKGCKDE